MDGRDGEATADGRWRERRQVGGRARDQAFDARSQRHEAHVTEPWVGADPQTRERETVERMRWISNLDRFP